MLQTILNALSQSFSWWVVVAPWEQALRIRGGKKIAVLQGGVFFRIPFWDRIYRQSIRRRISMIRPQVLTTSDGRAVTLAGALAYRIEDIRTLFDNLSNPEDTLEGEVTSLVSEFLNSQPYSDGLSHELQAHVRANLDLEKYGLGGVDYFLTSFASVRTYRMITGDLPVWSRGKDLNTDDHEGMLNNR